MAGSVFFAPQPVSFLRVSIATSSIGLKVLELPKCPIGVLVVSGFVKDEESALEAQGLRAGDVLVSINDIVVAFMSYADMANTLSMAELPVVLSFARHVRPPNAEFARPENVFIKQAPMLKKGKHFFNIVEREREFIASLQNLRFKSTRDDNKEVPVARMVALRHDHTNIYVETTERLYKFRCKDRLDLAEWLYAFLCVLHLQGDVAKYCKFVDIVLGVGSPEAIAARAGVASVALSPHGEPLDGAIADSTAYTDAEQSIAQSAAVELDSDDSDSEASPPRPPVRSTAAAPDPATSGPFGVPPPPVPPPPPPVPPAGVAVAHIGAHVDGEHDAAHMQLQYAGAGAGAAAESDVHGHGHAGEVYHGGSDGHVAVEGAVEGEGAYYDGAAVNAGASVAVADGYSGNSGYDSNAAPADSGAAVSAEPVVEAAAAAEAPGGEEEVVAAGWAAATPAGGAGVEPTAAPEVYIAPAPVAAPAPRVIGVVKRRPTVAPAAMAKSGSGGISSMATPVMFGVGGSARLKPVGDSPGSRLPAAAAASSSGRFGPAMLRHVEEDEQTERVAEEDKVRKLFRQIDASGDGSISVTEFNSAARASKIDGLKDNLHAILKLFSVMDADGNGSVDENEFVTALTGNSDPAFLQWLDSVVE